MRKWSTDGTAKADTRVGWLEKFCVEIGCLRVANILADSRVNRPDQRTRMARRRVRK